MLFSTLIHGVATHLITSAANLTQSVPLNWELIFVFCALLSYPPLQFFSSSIQSVLFPPQKRNETSAFTPRGEGEHRDSYVEKD